MISAAEFATSVLSVQLFAPNTNEKQYDTNTLWIEKQKRNTNTKSDQGKLDQLLLQNLQQVCSLLSWLRQIIANWSPPFHHCISGAFFSSLHFGCIFSFSFPTVDESPTSTTRGIFIWWPAVRFGGSIILVINYPTTSGRFVRRANYGRTALTMCWTPPHTLTPPQFTLYCPTPLIYPQPWDFHFLFPNSFGSYFICCWENVVFLVWN